MVTRSGSSYQGFHAVREHELHELFDGYLRSMALVCSQATTYIIQSTTNLSVVVAVYPGKEHPPLLGAVGHLEGLQHAFVLIVTVACMHDSRVSCCSGEQHGWMDV